MILNGDCIEKMREMDADSIHAIVCDPPYGLEFMGKDWDAPHKAWDNRKRDEQREVSGRKRGGYIGLPERSPSRFTAGASYQQWTTAWATEALRVLKPGGSMLCFAGTRTWHRLGVGLEDAGWQVKDTLMFCYGSGFPKAQDAEKAMTRKWLDSYYAQVYHGYKIGGIKPAWEPILWAVKPPEGSWTDNVLVYGVGSVNVDECRVGTDTLTYGDCTDSGSGCYEWNRKGEGKTGDSVRTVKGRFPANLLLSHHPDCRQVGVKKVTSTSRTGPKPDVSMGDRFLGNINEKDGKAQSWDHADPDGLETVEAWDCHPDCPVRLLDEQSGVSQPTYRKGDKAGHGGTTHSYISSGIDKSCKGYSDTGGASRFFYSSKATDRDDYNDHPTLKPTPIIEWLIRLVTRPGQTVLDPFAGSGTTGVAAVQSGREYVLIEQDEHYVEIIERRLSEVQMGFF